MADKPVPIKDKHGKIIGWKGGKAGSYVEPTKPTEGAGIAGGEAKQCGTEPMPKQSDFPGDTAGWGTAVRKWRERQRTCAEAAGAMGGSKK